MLHAANVDLRDKLLANSFNPRDGNVSAAALPPAQIVANYAELGALSNLIQLMAVNAVEHDCFELAFLHTARLEARVHT